MVRMLSLLIAGGVAIGSSQLCCARLGETEAELEARYGNPLGEKLAPEVPVPAEKVLTFKKDGEIVVVELWRGRSASEWHVFRDGGGNALAAAKCPQRVAAALEANSQGSSWEAHGDRSNIGLLQFWSRQDGSAVAWVKADMPDAVQIQTLDFMDTRMKTAK